ncbi:uncharacterized protein LOC130665191 [Microplitis mediator]|uniref:uncharacterized protein LOC130665191 n=1 Tax=Microplitis mediator TaxID=375433 RepID=UPI0025547DA8|nr:uncharacterized protein LOC130665191 [Microplitis mediator]
MGVRFVRQDYMIHVQIKESRLGQIGYNLYDPWKKLEDFDYDQKTEKYFIKNLNGSKTLTMGIDYGHPEVMNFDDLIAPEGFVVTGVRFRFARDSLDLPGLKSNPVELQIRVSPFDYMEKKIINHDQTHWMSPEQKHERDELILNDPDIPTKSSENLIDSSEGQFIRFRASDLRKDAGQSTVPFFDAIEAEGYPGFPLGGIGIIHRGRKGFGGYLAFKILDLDLSHYFKDDFFR